MAGQKNYNLKYMYLTIHAAAGAFIGEQVSSGLLAFILGFLSHFILDIFPHGDHELIRKYRKGEKVKTMFNAVLIDGIATTIFVLLVFTKNNLINTNIVAWGILGSILPDLFVGIYELTKKYFRRFRNFHYALHDFLKFDFSYLTGFIIQILIFLLFIKL